jgi:cellulose biosynthesis protein BcsQ
MLTIAYTSEKGGVGKTGSTVMHAVLLAMTLASVGERVLVFDVDPQAHTGKLLGHGRETHIGLTMKDVLLDETGGISLRDVIVPTYLHPETAQFVDVRQVTGEEIRGPDLVPITLAANTLDFDMKSRLAYWPERVAEILQPVFHEYAYGLFDCPPGLLAPTMSVYSAVDFLAFPLTPDILGVEGFQGAISAMRKTQKRHTKLQAAGAFFNKVHHWRTDKDVIEQVAELIRQSNLDIPLLETTIPESKDYNEAMTEDGSLVVLSRPDSKCARSYWYILDQLLERVGGPAQSLVKNIVLKMKKEDQEREEQRKQKRKTFQKGA